MADIYEDLPVQYENIEYEEPKPRVGVATIVHKGPNILLGKSKKKGTEGQWVIPGGGIREYETIQEASTREIAEETGVVCGNQEMLFLSERVNKAEKEHRIVIYVVGQWLSGEIKAGDDLSEVRWVDPRDLGLYQHQMGEMTIDAFMKYSMVLKAKAMSGRPIAQMEVPPNQVN